MPQGPRCHGATPERDDAVGLLLQELAEGLCLDGTKGAFAVAIKTSMPQASPGIGTGMPSWVYCLSLLRKVRIEMPRMFAAWVRLPRQ